MAVGTSSGWMNRSDPAYCRRKGMLSMKRCLLPVEGNSRVTELGLVLFFPFGTQVKSNSCAVGPPRTEFPRSSFSAMMQHLSKVRSQSGQV